MNTSISSEPPPKQHLGYLDALRAVAAILVVLNHCIWHGLTPHSFDCALQQANFPSALKPILYACGHLLFVSGHYCVGFFLVLSGFCLMLPVVKGDGTIRGGVFQFFKRRAWRILPPYYAAVAFSLLLIKGLVHEKTSTLWDGSIPVTGKSVLTHLILIHDRTGDNFTINHVFWSIAVEWRIYFLFPLLLLGWRRFGPLATTAGTACVSYALFRLNLPVIRGSLGANYFGLFTDGMLATSIVFSSNPFLTRLRHLPWGWVTLFLTVLVNVLTFVPLKRGEVIPVDITDYFVGLWSVSLLVMLTRSDAHWLLKPLNAKPLVFLGTFAYSIYLIHAPLIQVLWQYLFVPLQKSPLLMLAALSFISTPIIIGISYLFFLAFERPFLGRGKKSTTPLRVVKASA